MSIGEGKAVTHVRVKLLKENFMEALNLGLTYTALSRCEKEENWCLVDKIPFDRLSYINNHPHMKERREEEKRLQELSEETISKYIHYLNDTEHYKELLHQLDAYCNDGIETVT